MADLDYFRSAMRSDYDAAIQLIQDCQPDKAADQIGYAVVKDIRKTFKECPQCWTQHVSLLNHLENLHETKRKTYVIECLPHAPNKAAEVLRRATLALTVDIQFNDLEISNPGYKLFSTWMIGIAEYELLSRLEITSQTGEERRSDCMSATIKRVRELLAQRFHVLASECSAGEDNKRLKWAKPAAAKPDTSRAGIQGLSVPVRRPKAVKGERHE